MKSIFTKFLNKLGYNKPKEEIIEMEPYHHIIQYTIKIQSIEVDGEDYCKKIMKFYHNKGWDILNISWERRSEQHNRLGDIIPYTPVTQYKLVMEKFDYRTHNGEESVQLLENSIYQDFQEFNNNPDDMDYITWISSYYVKFQKI